MITLPEDPAQRAAYCLGAGCEMEKVGDFEAAHWWYRNALALEPSDPELCYSIHNNLGYSLIQLRDYENAIRYLGQAVTINRLRQNAYKNLALALQGKGDVIGAARLFVLAIRVNPNDSRSLKHLEDLLAVHPELLVDIPNLRQRLDACQEAVNRAKGERQT